MSRWMWLVTFAVGCGAAATPASGPAVATLGTTHTSSDAGVAPPPPLALEDDPPRLAAAALVLYQDLAKALETSDCKEATAQLEAVATAHADVIAANEHVLHAGHEKVKAVRAAIQVHEAEFDAAAAAIAGSPSMKQCAQDPAFAHAIDRLAGEGG